MKIKNIIFFAIINLLALILISSIVNRTSLKNKYQDRFKKNSFIMCDSILVETTPDSLFDFYTHHLQAYYSQTAKIHQQFDLLNSDTISIGTKILCKEGTDEEMVCNHYEVKELMQGEYLHWSSEPSTIEIKTKHGIKKNYCNTYVYLDFEDLRNHKTLHKLTIVLQMPNYLHKLIGKIVGGKKAKTRWENHVKEELEGLRNVFYKHCKKEIAFSISYYFEIGAKISYWPYNVNVTGEFKRIDSTYSDFVFSPALQFGFWF